MSSVRRALTISSPRRRLQLQRLRDGSAHHQPAADRLAAVLVDHYRMECEVGRSGMLILPSTAKSLTVVAVERLQWNAAEGEAVERDIERFFGEVWRE